MPAAATTAALPPPPPRTFLVTGASKGIGRAIAQRLARDGHSIIVHYHNDEPGARATLASLAAPDTVATPSFDVGCSTLDVGRSPEAHRLLQFDVRDRAACAATLEEHVSGHGPLYGVILNAGIARDGAFPSLSAEDWDDVLRTDLDGFYNVLHPVLPAMIAARRGGRIVTISSVSGLTGNRGQVNYSAAKAGLIGATKALAVELARRRITVNCVAPGLIDTGMLDLEPGLLEQIIEHNIPARRIGTPDEVASLVAWLASDESAYVTRQVISINGGML
ncbi:3-oxoacyl-ACP reductase FabG [Opitutaceae bacterium TAV4]|nr:3-oxoacyl-ACP reductase FabG [Opitutaceae bacterium TAV4]RRJ95255.1 3-oxoacyl-ACP reductase FabG [Opitutaceae bacterium TAV4]